MMPDSTQGRKYSCPLYARIYDDDDDDDDDDNDDNDYDGGAVLGTCAYDRFLIASLASTPLFASLPFNRERMNVNMSMTKFDGKRKGRFLMELRSMGRRTYIVESILSVFYFDLRYISEWVRDMRSMKGKMFLFSSDIVRQRRSL